MEWRHSGWHHANVWTGLQATQPFSLSGGTALVTLHLVGHMSLLFNSFHCVSGVHELVPVRTFKLVLSSLVRGQVLAIAS